MADILQLDKRVLLVGRMVNERAKRHDLDGTADEYPNSYAYQLLTIHYMQSTSPPVVPNLQQPGEGSVPVLDNKWGDQDPRRTQFEGDMTSLPKSANTRKFSRTTYRFISLLRL